MTKEQMTNLNFRRQLVKENISSLKRRQLDYRERLQGIDERIHNLENVYNTINIEILNYLSEENIPKVNVIKYIDDRENERLMLKIDIDDSNISIYKTISPFEIALYLNNNEVIDQMSFLGRCNEIALEYLRKNSDVSSLFNDLSQKVDEILPHFIESERVKLILKRGRNSNPF